MIDIDRYKLVGQTVNYRTKEGLYIPVLIKGFKCVYGRDRYLITPINGANETWVEYIFDKDGNGI